MVVQKCQLVIALKIRNLGSNYENFKKLFRNFEAQIAQKLRNLRLDHFSDFLIKNKSIATMIIILIILLITNMIVSKKQVL